MFEQLLRQTYQAFVASYQLYFPNALIARIASQAQLLMIRPVHHCILDECDFCFNCLYPAYTFCKPPYRYPRHQSTRSPKRRQSAHDLSPNRGSKLNPWMLFKPRELLVEEPHIRKQINLLRIFSWTVNS